MRFFKFTTNFTEETVEAGEAWVNEHNAWCQGYDWVLNPSILFTDYVDKGVAIVELAKN